MYLIYFATVLHLTTSFFPCFFPGNIYTQYALSTLPGNSFCFCNAVIIIRVGVIFTTCLQYSRKLIEQQMSFILESRRTLSR